MFFAQSNYDIKNPPLKVYTPQMQVAERMQSLAASRPDTFRAMYSSAIGGITTDPAAMVIPMDDHMVHRGHGVFDTAIIYDG